MGFEAARLLTNPPKGPVIAAGSTGTVPATARLLKVIASLPNGAVVLPGLDYFLDDESWASLARSTPSIRRPAWPSSSASSASSAPRSASSREASRACRRRPGFSS